MNFLIIISILSCGQNSFEKSLNGKWYETENENISWNFYPDSLVLKSKTETEEKVEWRATESKIEFNYPTHYWDSLGKIINIKDSIIINYELSSDKDSLFGTLKNRYGEHKFGLFRSGKN